MDFIDESFEGKGDTIIEDGAWLGICFIFLTDLKIGKGVIIAANNIVTKNVKPHS